VTEKELGKSGLIALLHRKGVKLRTAEQSISAELADAEVARELAIDVGAATLAARRILYSVDGPVDVLHSWYRGDLYESRTSLRFSWSGDQLTVRAAEPRR
jgi:GntR family transcriptional regulator